MGTSVAKIFDMTAASVGTNEKVLGSKGLERGKNYETLLINQNSHAGYYPGATQMFLKLIFSLEEGNRILGAQIVGADGVDKRIDTIAVAMKLGASVQKLKELELSYAPPYSSAKDPVNMAGFVAENILKGLVAFAPYDVVESETDALMLDVREGAERMAYGLPDSLGVSLARSAQRSTSLNRRSRSSLTRANLAERSSYFVRQAFERTLRHESCRTRVRRR